jgi:hypothetical protein
VTWPSSTDPFSTAAGAGHGGRGSGPHRAGPILMNLTGPQTLAHAVKALSSEIFLPAAPTDQAVTT